MSNPPILIEKKFTIVSRRSSPSVTTSTPATSWSRTAERTAFVMRLGKVDHGKSALPGEPPHALEPRGKE